MSITGRSSSAALRHQSLQQQLNQQQLQDGGRTSSFRVYYGGSSGAVPFKWESAPGTPIHALSSSTSASATLLPLTPPPSFHRTTTITDTSRPKSNPKLRPSLRPKLLTYVLQKLVASKKKMMAASHVSPLYSSSSLSSSSSPSFLGSYNSVGWSSSGKKGCYLRIGRLCGSGSYSRPRSPMHSGGDYFEDDHGVVRTLSFGSGSVDSMARFDEKKKVLRGCFGL